MKDYISYSPITGNFGKCFGTSCYFRSCCCCSRGYSWGNIIRKDWKVKRNIGVSLVQTKTYEFFCRPCKQIVVLYILTRGKDRKVILICYQGLNSIKFSFFYPNDFHACPKHGKIVKRTDYEFLRIMAMINIALFFVNCSGVFFKYCLYIFFFNYLNK